MTTATTEGRRLLLTVNEEISFHVDPLSAVRGKQLTDLFVYAAQQRLSATASESMFIEAFGPANYSRATGLVVDRLREDAAGADVLTDSWAGDVHTVHDAKPSRSTAIYIGRPQEDEDPIFEALPLRQSEIESLCLCAFYWQTVVGMEAVQTFIEGGEGAAAHLKASSLYVTRGLLSLQPGSSNAVSELLTTAADSSPAPGTASSSASVLLPARRKPQDRKPKAGKNPRT